MKNPLNKRYFRELKNDFGKYIALCLFLIVTIGFCSGFLVADGSTKGAYDESFEKYNIEDGHFILAKEADSSLIDKLEKENLSIGQLFYKDVDRKNNHTIRLYKNRTKVNKVCLMDGNMPKADDEIAIDRLYGENNNIVIGDKIDIGNKDYKVTGYIALSDYSALFKNNTDMMFDANKFSVAIVTDKAFDDVETEAKYCYTWNYTSDSEKNMSDKQLTKKSEKIQDILTESGLLTDYVLQRDNQAINFTGEDMGGDMVMVMVLLYIVMAIIAFVFGITTRNTIEQEAGAIGTLRASGYTKQEMVRHYFILPALITFIAAVIGNILGYTVMKFYVASMYYGSYSLPTYVTKWNADAFILTTVIPCIIVFVVTLIVLNVSLRISPLQFLRHDLKKNKKSKVVKLPNFKFKTRFRLRIIFQNTSTYITLFLGILFASVLLMFGMMMSPLLTNFKDRVLDSKIANYQYILKAPIEVDDKDTEKYAVSALNTTDSEEEITIYGVNEDSKYINTKNIPDTRNQVLVSKGYMEKYGLKENQTIELKEKFGSKKYKFTIKGTYIYPASLCIFMTRENFNKVFDKDKDYFCGYFSNKKLDIDDMYVASIITEKDLTVMSDQLEDSMGQAFYLFWGFATLIYIIVIYILAKMIIEKNKQSISMIKILGYTDKEVSSLYNIATAIIVIASMIICVPISEYIIKYIYYVMMKDFNGWLDYYIAPWIYPGMVLIGVVCYFVVHIIQMKKIKKIPMEQALKNVE